MATENSITCDVCGVGKRAVNHWWKVWIAPEKGPAQLRIVAADAPSSAFAKDACGQAHLHTLVDRWMETGSLEKPEVFSGTAV
jgi:hypothetical protein